MARACASRLQLARQSVVHLMSVVAQRLASTGCTERMLIVSRPEKEKRPKLNTDELFCTPVTSDINLKYFSCNYTYIDDYLHRIALIEHEVFDARSTIVFREGVASPVGFYTLCLRHESASSFTNSKSWIKRIFQGSTLVTAHLLWCGVDTRHQRCGIGSYLLAKAIDDFYYASMIVGLPAMTLVSMNTNSSNFYKTLGFDFYDGSDRKMQLSIQDVIAARSKVVR